MNISQIVNNTINTTNNNLPKTAEQKTQEKGTTLATDNVDKFDSNSVNFNRNYQSDPHRTENQGVHGYKGMSSLQIKNSVLSDYVNFTLRRQTGNDFWNDILGLTFTPKSFAVEAFNAAEASSTKYGDYWGVDAVAERIFTFAKTLAGERGNELFDTMKNAFLKGFNMAEGTVKGSKLPGISYDTKNKVLELFDAWEKEINSPAEPPVDEQAPGGQ
jgi:hypothetical protein